MGLKPQEEADRRELWAELKTLRPDILRLASGGYDASERDGQIVALLARIVAAEMDFRAREAE